MASKSDHPGNFHKVSVLHWLVRTLRGCWRSRPLLSHSLFLLSRCGLACSARTARFLGRCILFIWCQSLQTPYPATATIFVIGTIPLDLRYDVMEDSQRAKHYCCQRLFRITASRHGKSCSILINRPSPRRTTSPSPLSPPPLATAPPIPFLRSSSSHSPLHQIPSSAQTVFPSYSPSLFLVLSDRTLYHFPQTPHVSAPDKLPHTSNRSLPFYRACTDRLGQRRMVHRSGSKRDGRASFGHRCRRERRRMNRRRQRGGTRRVWCGSRL